MKNNRGFTLVEMMIAVAIFGIVMTGVYQTYDSQQKTYIKKDQVIDMQQNHRTAIYFLGQELRMAGYDPTGDANMGSSTATTITSPGFTKAGIHEFEITMDQDGDMTIAGTNETIRYALSNDDDGDGISDSIDADWVNSGAECNLGRETGGAGGLQPVANNIDAVEFLYVLKDGTVTESPSANELVDIRGIIVSVLARTKNRIKGYRNTHTYIPASRETDAGGNYLIPDTQLTTTATRPDTSWGPFDDNYRRNLYITRFRCRNMGRNPHAGI